MLNRIKNVENGGFSTSNIIVMKSAKLEILTPPKNFNVSRYPTGKDKLVQNFRAIGKGASLLDPFKFKN